MNLKLLFVLSFILPTACLLHAQDSTGFNKVLSSPDKLFASLNKKTSSIESKLDKQTIKYLSRLRKQEGKLQKKLYKKDSLLAKQLFEGVDDKYKQLSKEPENISKYSAVYSGHLDSLTTSLNFLKDGRLSDNPQLEKTLEQYKTLQGKLNQADAIKKYVSERQKLLMQQFENLGMVKELRGFQKQGYYYSAQIKEYKEAFEDPDKIEEKLLQAVQKLPQFKKFFADNSVLGSLFPLSGGSAVSTVSLQGLQTRASVNQSLIDRFGSGPNTTQMLQQNMQAAQVQLSSLKSKINQYSSGSYGNSSSNIDMPADFKPNQQKTKSFFQRLEYGANLQSSRGSSYFPVTSDLGLSLGYKISDQNSLGLGISYKIGWGSSWDHIKVTHQGVGLRSYLDMKLKGSLYVSGGYEQNYRSEIHAIQQLKDYSAWQSSGLVGLSKKYKLKGKMKGEMKLLWDFLSYQQVPRTQAVLFRIAYNLK